MGRTKRIRNIERQKASYDIGVPKKDSVDNTTAEANHAISFEKKWAKAISLDKAFKEVHDYLTHLYSS